MVQALLTSIKNMLGSQATQTKEFKTEAVKNNRNVSVALKDIYKMFSATRESDSRNSTSLGNIESSTAATSDKVDQSNSLLRESISLQTEMISELKGISRAILALTAGNNSNLLDQNQQSGGIGAALSSMAKIAGFGAAAGGGLGLLNNYFGGNILPGSGSTSTVLPFSGETNKILETIRTVESGGNYTTPNKAGTSSASGAYQFIDSTWQSLAQKYGVGTEYRRAMDAPPEIQDAVAGKYVEEILSQNGDDVSKIPLVWYTGNAQGRMSAKALAANKGQAAEAYQSKWLNAYQSIVEGDDSGTYTTASAGPQDGAMGSSGGRVVENQAGIRRLPINSRLKSVLEQAAAAAGVDVEVFSGGQPRQGEGGQRTGSTRHDHGNAADVYLYREGRKLRDPDDREIMAKFVSAAAAAGATGIGFGGPGQYMGESGIHIGFGKPATWGGSPWIASAASGVFSNRDLQAENTDTSGSYASGGGGMGGVGGIPGMNSDALLATLGAYFGMSFGALSPLDSISNLFSSGFDESTEQEPNDMMGRSAGPGGIPINSKDKTPVIEGDYQNYENTVSKLQAAAIEDKKPQTVNDPKMAAYSSQGESAASADFGAMSSPGSSRNETRASWAPRIAVLRPDDDVTKPLTWAARIKGYA